MVSLSGYQKICTSILSFPRQRALGRGLRFLLCTHQSHQQTLDKRTVVDPPLPLSHDVGSMEHQRRVSRTREVICSTKLIVTTQRAQSM